MIPNYLISFLFKIKRYDFLPLLYKQYCIKSVSEILPQIRHIGRCDILNENYSIEAKKRYCYNGDESSKE